MLKDVTLGQFFPGQTPIHKLDPRTKLVLVIVYIVALFLAKWFVSYAAIAAFLALVIAMSQIRLKVVLKNLKPLLFIIILTALLNLFYGQGEPIAQFWIFKITKSGIQNAVFMVLRISLLVAGTFMLTYTTSPIALTDGLESLLSPLKKLHAPVHELSMMMSIALRFIPILVEETDKILYGLAPLPFATGLFPLALKEDIDIRFLPEVEDAVNMSFGERNKEGFKMAMKQDVEFFFGLGSVAYAVSQSLTGSVSSGKSKTSFSELLQYKPKMLKRILNAKKICKKEKRELLPKDLFHLKGFMVAGTDNQCYKDDLEEMWGVRPMELFAGTEPSIIGTETWTRNGMYFFPDTCFYEFITEKDMLHNYEDPTFTPPTYLMDEVVPGEKYELVITVLKGGAFARYRVGDMYRCVGLTNQEDRTQIPRFEYVDRVPWIIDIAGFTRISENGIKSVIQLSGQPVTDWIAVKEYNEKKRPYLHLYIEVKKEALMYQAMSTDILKELLTTYFKYIDQDYRDLKKILGMDPLVVTILRCGTFHLYESRNGRKPRHMSTPYYEVAELLRLQDEIGSGNMRK